MYIQRHIQRRIQRRLLSTILLGLIALLGSCRSPQGSSLGRSISHRLSNFGSDFNRYLVRQDRLSDLSTTTGKLINLETRHNHESDLRSYLFWDRNFNRLGGFDANKLGRTVIMGPRVSAPPGNKGSLAHGSLTDPMLRTFHLSESLKKLFLLEQRFPDLAGWQSIYRD